MGAENERKFAHRLQLFSLAMAISCALLGAVVLLGWAFDIVPMKQVLTNLESMKANTAIGFLAAGTGLWVSVRSSGNSVIATVIGLAVSVFAAAILSQDLLGITFGIDELLFTDEAGAVTWGEPGRMAPPTALVFILSGLAIAGIAANRLILLAQLLSLGSLSIGFVALTGYLFGAANLYSVLPYSAMSLLAAGGCLILNLGILSARPGSGVVQPLLEQSSSAILMRRLVPLAVVLPIALGAILVAAERFAVFNFVVAMAVTSVASTLLLLALIWWSAHAIALHERSIRAERNYFATTLRSIGDAVIVTDTSGRIVFMNAIAEALTGYTLAEARKQTLESVFVIVNEETRATVESPAAKALRLGKVVGLANHTVLISKSGHEYCIDDSGAPIRGPSDATQGAVLVFRDTTERRKADLVLRESETRFRELAHGLPLMIWVHDAQGNREFVNHTYRDFFGIREEDLPVLRWQELVHPDDTDYGRSFESSLKERKPFHAEARVRRADGDWRTVESFGQPRFSANGQFLGIVGTSVDITDRVRTQEQNRDIRHRLENALEIGRLGEWFLDLRTGSAERNLRHDQIFGYDELLPEWTYEKFIERVYAADRDQVDTAFQAALKRGKDWNVEARILRADGALRWIWARGSVIEFEQGAPVRMSGIVQDITQRRRLDDANRFLADIATPLNTLVDYESTLRSVARLAVPYLADWCAIDLADASGRLHRVANSHAEPELSGIVHQLRLSYEDPTVSTLGKILEDRRPRLINNLTEADMRALASDAAQFQMLQELRPAAFIGVPMVIRDSCLGVIAFFSSDSGRQFSKADVQLAERVAERISVALENAKLYESVREADERKDVFLAMLAHELRNPLGALSNGLEVLRTKFPGEQNRWTFEMLDRQKRQLTRLLDDLMDVSRISRGKVILHKHNISLNAVLTEAATDMQASVDEKRHKLSKQFGDDDIAVSADPVRLKQIVTNLLSNAVKYTPPGGSITLSAVRDGSDVVIKVADSGVGIAEDQLFSIFDLFEQVRAEDSFTTVGLGLGLALVRDLVEMHGGTVTATSEGENMGSDFSVRLPTVDERKVDSSDGRKAVRATTKALDILAVDDNSDSIRALGVLLEQQGHRVRLAYDGRSALDAVAENRPDLILLDIGLPDISGYEVARRVRNDATSDGVVLVAVTGYGQPRDFEQSKAAGFDEHLVKPVDINALNAIIDQQEAARA